MTDNEIIKALECCKQNCLSKCLSCPAGKVYEFCSQEIMNDAIDLINRQKAEIEVLQKRIVFWREDLNYNLKKERAEARKEFAEELRSKTRKYTEYDEGGWDRDVYAVEVAEIDNVLKEMEKENGI